MKRTRFIIGFAFFGFFWSFIFGLFSHGGFFRMCIIALIFAAVFACLGFLIVFLFNTVFKIDTVQQLSDEKPATGGIVDIVVQDEDLPKDEEAPQFYVGESHQMLADGDYEKSDSYAGVTEDTGTVREHDQDATSKEKPADTGFVPVPLKETVAARSGEDVLKPKGGVSKDETLDELPSFQDLQVLQAASFSNEHIDSDTDFSVSHREEKKSDSTFSEKDTALMAKAISTVLAKENQ